MDRFLTDRNEQIHGGILGEICWNWLKIHTLLIDEGIHGLCYASNLLLEIEQITLNNNVMPFRLSELCLSYVQVSC